MVNAPIIAKDGICFPQVVSNDTIEQKENISGISKAGSSCSLTTTPKNGKRTSDKLLGLKDLEANELKVLTTLGKGLENLSSSTIYNKNEHHVSSIYFAGKSKISLVQYLSRVIKYINQLKISTGDNVSPGMRALVMAVLYTDRLSAKIPGFVVTSENIHRLYLVAMMTSTKMIEDSSMSAAFWAKVGGISTKELIRLENKFCMLMDYDFHVEQEEFWLYMKQFAGYAQADGLL